MTNEEIQLYNDIVKSGFPVLGTLCGGLVGAASTYLLTKLNNDNDEKKDAQKLRNDLLMKTANDVAEFEHLMAIYTTTLANYLREQVDDGSLKTAYLNSFNSNLTLRKARMNLHILGMEASLELLEGYVEATREVLAYGKRLDIKRAIELNQKISKGPILFYQSLSIDP
ncbi:hypothetical protein [Vibrio crassostreae]|uniref:hypothetical protein n=1 Tax=Vibrio crassostreae TaxID=246167 RepID=UPI0003617704|nr:hypothetical protein [Vibrio crassostreae]OEE91010.1 hypothetical protein A140_16440 [Vibrio crassostreae 9ZC88]